ncbi:hypothetical protein [Streptomyces sp. NPDC058092]|uniref:hypothetical protein n=1 Tax=Streptomyces sp. NPDC058092 TaxID=3346336 RepID=UPI0036E08E4A
MVPNLGGGIESSLPFARSILAAAPTPSMAAKLTRQRLQSLLEQAGRVHGIQT